MRGGHRDGQYRCRRKVLEDFKEMEVVRFHGVCLAYGSVRVRSALYLSRGGGALQSAGFRSDYSFLAGCESALTQVRTSRSVISHSVMTLAMIAVVLYIGHPNTDCKKRAISPAIALAGS